MSPITTHVLDTARGCPAAGLPITLEIQSEAGWQTITRATTNTDGRVAALMDNGTLEPGIYRMTFDTGTYFKLINVTGFYPYVPVIFEIVATDQHYHVPLLLSPFGYSTYRGS